MNEKTFARLIDDLKSDDYAKVEDAANTLCAVRDSNILPFILKTLDEANQPLVQRVLLLTLCNYDNIDYGMFLSYLTNADEDVKEAAQNLFLSGKNDGFSVLVEALKNSENEQLKCSILTTLGQYRKDTVIQPLLEALDDVAPVVRIVSIYSLTPYLNPEVTSALLSHLGDTDEEVVGEALYALRGRILSENQLLMVSALLSRENTEIRSAAVTVMNVHVPDAMADDSDAKVRRAVAEVTVSPAVLSRLCSDENSSVKMAAIDSVFKNGLKMDEVLIPLVHDENPGVRRSAATALGNSSGDKVIHALTEVLHDSKPGVCAAAARSLGKIGGEEAKKVLENSKNTNNPILSGIITEALSQIK